MKSVEISELLPEHAQLLSSILLLQPPAYMQHFLLFSFDEKTVRTILSKKNDRYWEIFAGEDIAGFFMLRGFDAGFAIPSYGVWINYLYARHRLAKLTIQYAADVFCKINAISTVMLKVDPENHVAKKLYGTRGFVFDKIDPQTNHLIYFKKIS